MGIHAAVLRPRCHPRLVDWGARGRADPADPPGPGRPGVGQSLRYLKKNGRGLAGLLRSDGYDPDQLLDALDADLEALGITGVHLFTFNQLGAAVDWQRSLAA